MSPLIDFGISREEATAQILPGEYEAEYQGLLLNENEPDESKKVIHTAVSGNRMVKARFRIVNCADPKMNGKNLPIYNAMIGQFSFDDFTKAIPDFWGPEGPDDAKGIGTVVKATVGFGKGQYSEVLGIAKLRPKR